MKKIGIIGSGIAGLTAASILGSKGYDVSLFEKNECIGGRARVLKSDGFTFDMGPSWYWMPEVFENFFQKFGHTTSDFYELKRLSPSFTVIFENAVYEIPDSFDELVELFESIETGAGARLISFLDDAKLKYDLAMKDLIFKPGNSISEYLNIKTISSVLGVNLFFPFLTHAKKYFSHPHLLSLISFPTLFLGATPSKTPALYSLMNYAAFKLGTWYPAGGFGKVIEAFKTIAKTQGVKFYTSSEVEKIIVDKGNVHSIVANGEHFNVDAIVGAADYNHIEQKLIDKQLRQYSEKYWNERVMSPSSLLFYIGIDKKIAKLNHHNLFFDADFDLHIKEIFDAPDWPTKPLFYVCCPSKSDPGVSPAGMENIFILMPLATGIVDNMELREKYFEKIVKRMEDYVGESLTNHIVFKKSYCANDFVKDYHAYKGNAYGLANTLMQTALLKPKMSSSKIKNLFYTGQLTVPGPGIPPSIISGQIVSEMLSSRIPA